VEEDVEEEEDDDDDDEETDDECAAVLDAAAELDAAWEDAAELEEPRCEADDEDTLLELEFPPPPLLLLVLELSDGCLGPHAPAITVRANTHAFLKRIKRPPLIAWRRREPAAPRSACPNTPWGPPSVTS